MKRQAILISASLLAGSTPAQAVSVKLRPQGEALSRAVQMALNDLSTKDIPFTLDASSGTTLTLGGVGVSAAPFNPDEVARVVQVGGERRIEFNPQNPQGPVNLVETVKQELLHELGLKTWTPAAAQLRFGGADLNGDGQIDLADLAILMANYGLSNPSAGDLNQDRKVDDTDVRIFMAQYHPTAEITDPTATATSATGSTGGSGAVATTPASSTNSPASAGVTPAAAGSTNVPVSTSTTPPASTGTPTPATTSPSTATGGTTSPATTTTGQPTTGQAATGTPVTPSTSTSTPTSTTASPATGTPSTSTTTPSTTTSTPAKP